MSIPGDGWHGAYGPAVFLGWYTNTQYLSRQQPVSYSAAFGSERTINVVAAYGRRINFQWAGSSTVTDVRIPYDGITSNDNNYTAPAIQNTLRWVNIPDEFGDYSGIQMLVTNEFAGWGLFPQVQGDEIGTTPMNPAWDVTEQVRNGSLEGFNFSANGTINLFAWYRMIENDTTRDITFVHNNNGGPQSQTVRVPIGAEIRFTPNVVPGTRFEGWFPQVNGGSPITTGLVGVDTPWDGIVSADTPNNMTVVAMYSYRLSFNLNGGTLAGYTTVPHIDVFLRYPTT